jgi:hypothetical protein
MSQVTCSLTRVTSSRDEALWFGNVVIVEEMRHETADGRTFLVLHGDRCACHTLKVALPGTACSCGFETSLREGERILGDHSRCMLLFIIMQEGTCKE